MIRHLVHGSLLMRMQATTTLLVLSPPVWVTLEAVAPLLERIRGAGGSLSTACSPAQLAALSSAIVRTGGDQPLTRHAADALIRLLSCEGVVRQLPFNEVVQVVQSSLAGGQQAGGGRLPDALAEALVERHVEAGWAPLPPSVRVFFCGASSGVVRRGARAMLQMSAACGRSPPDLLLDLLQLQATGIIEHAGVVVGHGVRVQGEGAAPGGHEHTASGAAAAAPAGVLEDEPGQQQQQQQQQQQGATDGGLGAPLADYVLEALRQLAEAARQGGMDVGVGGGREGVATMLRTAAELHEQLDGLQLRRRELLGSLHAIADSVRVPRVAAAGGGVDSGSGGSGGGLEGGGGGVEGGKDDQSSRPFLDILEAAFAIGKECRVGRARRVSPRLAEAWGRCTVTGGSCEGPVACCWLGNN